MQLTHRLITSLAIFSCVAFQTIVAEVVLIDFGVAGAQTAGNWNNVISRTDNKGNLINSEGDTTGISMTVSDGNFGGTNTFNGNVAADSTMFDPFEVASVITDALYVAENGSTGTLTFNGLDDSLTYNLVVTGARTTNTNRFTRYGVSGLNSQILQTSGNSPLAGVGVNWNNNSVVTFSGISGVSSFSLTVEGNGAADFGGSNQFGYINALELRAVPEPTSLLLLGVSGLVAFSFVRRKRA
ncbi:PEP-CTERM sorting domain-containing protein [Kiritimatiellota bacterium B12222]|nr:PEP-CTERM sorting domain-containing protein [Kiritimatiellota bacterium B12222]